MVQIRINYSNLRKVQLGMEVFPTRGKIRQSAPIFHLAYIISTSKRNIHLLSLSVGWISPIQQKSNKQRKVFPLKHACRRQKVPAEVCCQIGLLCTHPHPVAFQEITEATVRDKRGHDTSQLGSKLPVMRPSTKDSLARISPNLKKHENSGSSELPFVTTLLRDVKRAFPPLEPEENPRRKRFRKELERAWAQNLADGLADY
ncbi:hypothetical protein HDU84_009853 [Entophlyctis sp. JEL0112]|nr:hypothetical protein HDU84_009853 [Entophlyctis sp. JEL0112]